MYWLIIVRPICSTYKQAHRCYQRWLTDIRGFLDEVVWSSAHVVWILLQNDASVSDVFNTFFSANWSNRVSYWAQYSSSGHLSIAACVKANHLSKLNEEIHQLVETDRQTDRRKDKICASHNLVSRKWYVMSGLSVAVKSYGCASLPASSLPIHHRRRRRRLYLLAPVLCFFRATHYDRSDV